MSRTYLLARLWSEFSESFDTVSLDAVPDVELHAHLTRMAQPHAADFATQIMESRERHTRDLQRRDNGQLTTSHSGPRSKPHRTKSFDEQPATFGEIAVAAGWFRPNITGVSEAWTPPHWHVFYAEDIPGIAQAITKALPRRLGWSDSLIRIRTVDQRSLKPEEWACLELELHDFDQPRSDPDVMLRMRKIARDSWLDRLRREARALSAILSKQGTEVGVSATVPDAAVPQVVETTDSDVLTLFDEFEAPGVQEHLNKLKPSQRTAVRGFLDACRAVPALDRTMPTTKHHEWLKRNKVELLEGQARERPTTWITYVRHAASALFPGRGRRRHVTSRSIVRARDQDLPRTDRS